MTTTIFVCDTCRYSTEDKLRGDKTGGEILCEHVERLAQGNAAIEVKRQSCLMGCTRHCNIAVAAREKLAYVLGEFLPNENSAQAIVDYALLHAQSDTGQVPFREWPHGVKGHFVARIPLLGGETS
jgi:predicted metal-binding protein